MTNMKKRMDKIEVALNPKEYAMIEDILRSIHDSSIPRDARPLHPDLEKAFQKIAENRHLKHES
jgi:plasmid stabilization system protein ParE